MLPYISMNQLQVYTCPLPSETPPIAHPFHPSRWSQSTRSSSLYHMASSHLLFILRTVIYVSMLFSQFIPPSPSFTVSTKLLSLSASASLPCKEVHQYHLSRFHRHTLIYSIVFLFLTYFTLYNRL